MRNVWRCYIEPPTINGEEITVFVEAYNHKEAGESVNKIVSIIHPTIDESERDNFIYNIDAAETLLKTGESENIEYRLFETGWVGHKGELFVNHWCKAPIFAVKKPSYMFNAWTLAVSYFEKHKPSDEVLYNEK